jgi:hypothetical protein
VLGGGMLNWGSNLTLTNCTFAQNSAENGNALACDSYEQIYPSNVELINCILWNGGDEIWNNDNSTIMITYSNVQGGFPGEGNIDADPLFADPGYWADANDPNTAAEPNDPNAVWIDGDYHLKSQAGRWDPNSGSWVKDDVTSPCIDAGDPNNCLGYHEPYPNGLVINMGAYGGTDQASMSLSTDECIFYWFERYEWENVGMPICWCYPRQCHGDADCKAQGKQEYWVSTNDLDVLIAAWNKPFEEIEGKEVHGVPLICADFAHLPQGKQRFRVSFMDLDILIANWNIANGPAADCP